MADTSTILAKASFLGPRSENEAWVRAELQSVLDHWFGWRRALFTGDPPAIGEAERTSVEFLKVREKTAQQLARLKHLLEAETPIFSRRYLGHMVSEISLPALFGHFAALLHNPNNTSPEASKVGTVIEKEAIAMLADMLGYDPARARGHFTSGGTVANFEAVWRARHRLDKWLSLALLLSERDGRPFDPFSAGLMGWDRYFALIEGEGVDEAALAARSFLDSPFAAAAAASHVMDRPFLGPVMLVPGNKHFSWRKAADIFGVGADGFWTIPLDREGRLDCAGLDKLIERARDQQRPILMCVSVAGTTEAGEIDPVDRVADRLDKAGGGAAVWHHVDAAYGGFFCAIDSGAGLLGERTTAALDAIGRANSITIDPHKLGYVPYSCGAFLARDEENYAVAAFDAPYLQRSDLKAPAWASTLEGSRTAAGATAVWLSGKTLGFNGDGLGAILAETVQACRAFRARLTERLPFLRPLDPTDTNILCFSLAEPGDALAEANRKTQAVFERFIASPSFSVSRTVLAGADWAPLIRAHVASYDGSAGAGALFLIRCVFMNPFWLTPGAVDSLADELAEELRGYYRAA